VYRDTVIVLTVIVLTVVVLTVIVLSVIVLTVIVLTVIVLTLVYWDIALGLSLVYQLSLPLGGCTGTHGVLTHTHPQGPNTHTHTHTGSSHTHTHRVRTHTHTHTHRVLTHTHTHRVGDSNIKDGERCHGAGVLLSKRHVKEQNSPIKEQKRPR